MYLLDTNVWLERLLDWTRASEVARFLTLVPADELHLTDFTFHSIGVILTKMNQAPAKLRQLWTNPAHPPGRTSGAGILDYAKELSRWSYETFDGAVRAARRTEDNETGQGLLELVRRARPDVDEASFFDSVMKSLRRGDFLLLIVGDGIREGVASSPRYF